MTLLTVRQDPELPHIEEREGYTIVRYDPVASPLGNDISPGLARYLYSADDFDVIHAHSHLYFATNLAALKRCCGDIPLAITNHGLYSQSAPEGVFRWYLRSVGRWTFNQADVVFCYTETDRERVRELGVSSRIEVVPNGIDTERFSPDGPESELIDGSGPVVLFVGRFTEGKRPGVAVEAFAEVLGEYPNAKLYLCGEGPLRGELKAQVQELGIGESVTFLGHVPYDEMPRVYRSGDVLVLPSRAEGMPRTVLEALSTGVPVVGAELPQVQSIFDEEARYTSVDDIDTLGKHILQNLRKEANPSLDSEFGWERTVERTTAILNALSKPE